MKIVVVLVLLVIISFLRIRRIYKKEILPIVKNWKKSREE